MSQSSPSDTEPDARALQLEIYRRLGGPARSAIAFRLTDLVRRAAEAGIRSRHPDYDQEQVRRALLRVRLGDAAALAACPDARLVAP